MRKVFVLRSDAILKEFGRFIRANWQGMADAGSPMRVELSDYKSKRSRMQNDRYWAMLEQIEQQAMVAGRRYSKDCWHEYYKDKFLVRVDLPFGGSVPISTAILNVYDFNRYMKSVEADAAQEFSVRFFLDEFN